MPPARLPSPLGAHSAARLLGSALPTPSGPPSLQEGVGTEASQS